MRQVDPEEEQQHLLDGTAAAPLVDHLCKLPHHEITTVRLPGTDANVSDSNVQTVYICDYETPFSIDFWTSCKVDVIEVHVEKHGPSFYSPAIGWSSWPGPVASRHWYASTVLDRTLNSAPHMTYLCKTVTGRVVLDS